MSRLFGTDGVRGVANEDLTPELAFAVGRAAASIIVAHGDRRPIVVGRDTRCSGTMLEAAIVAGITSAGRDTVSLGIVPTPAVACVTRREGAAAGVMISASHNPVPDNGIKFFGADGFKLSDAIEDAIEAAMAAGNGPRPIGTEVGVARVAANLGKWYYEELYSGAADLSGLRVVVDGAYGAAYAIAPYALRKLGADVIELHCENDGTRINVGCGATHLESLETAVRERIAAGERNVVGVAFDGDADRALFIDEEGLRFSGDHVMYAMATALHDAGELTHDTIVGTVMSNIGFERALQRRGIQLERTAVGDRYVLERMISGGFVLGGEQSGHIIDLRNNTTGDGPMTAVTLLGIAARAGARLHDLASEVTIAPQLLVNVKTRSKDVLHNDAVRRAIADAETQLGESGRLLVRASGTEPLVRVMAEGTERALVAEVAQRVAEAIQREIPD
ncbi:MAG TPA: phosphoglucosamine mutase [Candidatus Tumulicola sp.]|jgi:phosphoglucosamine mutase